MKVISGKFKGKSASVVSHIGGGHILRVGGTFNKAASVKLNEAEVELVREFEGAPSVVVTLVLLIIFFPAAILYYLMGKRKSALVQIHDGIVGTFKVRAESSDWRILQKYLTA